MCTHWFAAVAFLGSVTACEGRSLTGPEAQRAFSEAAPVLRAVPSGVLVFVNEMPLADGHQLTELRVSTITSIEIVKGEAARSMYGVAGERGAIRVFTTDSAAAHRITRR